MPASPARIGFITRDVRVAVAGPNSDVEALYGDAARDTPEPLESFFDDVADAEAMAEERLALLEVQRSLVTVRLSETETAIGIDHSSELPTFRIIDDEQGRDSDALVTGITIDMGADAAVLDTWG